MFDILLLGVWISDETLLLVFDILLLGVWILDETLPLAFYILLLGVWISDETLPLVFDILLLGVLHISDESLLLVFDILLLGVWISDLINIQSQNNKVKHHLFLSQQCAPDRLGFESVGFEERGKPDHPKKNLSVKRRLPTTN